MNPQLLELKHPGELARVLVLGARFHDVTKRARRKLKLRLRDGESRDDDWLVRKRKLRQLHDCARNLHDRLSDANELGVPDASAVRREIKHAPQTQLGVEFLIRGGGQLGGNRARRKILGWPQREQHDADGPEPQQPPPPFSPPSLAHERKSTLSTCPHRHSAQASVFAENHRENCENAQPAAIMPRVSATTIDQ